MAQNKTSLLIAALLATTGLAQAQEQTAPATPAAETAAPAEAASPETPATEAPATDTAGATPVDPATAPPAVAPGEPAEGIGSAYLADTFEAWALRCIRTEDGKDPCQMYQLLKDTNGTPVADISIFPVLGEEKLKAGATVMTPLGTLLSQNLAIAVDGGKPMVYPYTFCTTEGCAARLALTETEVNSFKRGNEAKLMIVPAVAPDQRVELAISLKGFTAAFEAAQKANAE